MIQFLIVIMIMLASGGVILSGEPAIAIWVLLAGILIALGVIWETLEKIEKKKGDPDANR